MRITILVILLCWPALIWGQTEKVILVSGNHQNESLETILNYLDTQYPMDFYYQKEWLPTKNITIEYQEELLLEVVAKLLQNTDLTFSTFGEYAIILAPKTIMGKEYSSDYFKAKYQVVEVEEEVKTNQMAITIGSPEQAATSGKGTIRGTIEAKGAPIIGAVIFVEKINANAITDIDGRYELTLPIGKHVLEVQSIGYADYRRSLEIYDSGELEIALEEEVYELGEIVVAGTTSDNNVQSAQIGVARLTPLEIKQLPSFLGEADVIKSLFTLPGVSTAGEGATGFNVRGGNIDQNLVTQDGAMVYNSSHVLGFFSIFNADAIKAVTLYKGHIPAQYGGRLSSVLEVKTKDASNKEFKMRGGIGIVSSRLTAEIPLIKERTSLLLGGRSSYSDWILKRAKNLDLKNSSAYFYDFNAKLSHSLNNGSNLSLGYYQSYDFFRFSDQFGYDWGTQLATFNYNQLLGEKYSFSLDAAYGNLDNSFFDPEGFDAFTLQNGLKHLKGNADLFITALEGHEIHLGAAFIRSIGTPETIGARGIGSGTETRSVEKDRGQEFAFYINDDFDIGDFISISAGLRYSFYQNIGPNKLFLYDTENESTNFDKTIGFTEFSDGDIIKNYSALEPRVSLKLGVGIDNSIKLSYNRMAQYIHLISNTTASTPIDIWQVSTPYIPPQLANNYSIGYFQNFNSNQWETSLEVFYKDIEQLIEYKDLPTLLLNEQLETELLIGQGRAYGAELSLKKKTGRWTGQMSYTYSRSERLVDGETSRTTINEGQWFPSNFDSPHNLNLTFKYQVNRRHLLSANFTYRKGRPITAPVAAYIVGNTEIPHYSPRNQFRIPNYHRLDLAYTFNRNAVRTKRFKGSLTISVYNLYFRRNAFSVFFKRIPGTPANAFRLAVLGTAFPSITYNFEF